MSHAHQARWALWIRRRPRAATLLLGWARMDLARGAKRISVKAYWERLRAIRVDKHLDNSLTAYAARWLVKTEPRLRGVIELRGAA